MGGVSLLFFRPFLGFFVVRILFPQKPARHCGQKGNQANEDLEKEFSAFSPSF